jgi:hypothetical protein
MTFAEFRPDEILLRFSLMAFAEFQPDGICSLTSMAFAEFKFNPMALLSFSQGEHNVKNSVLINFDVCSMRNTIQVLLFQTESVCLVNSKLSL